MPITSPIFAPAIAAGALVLVMLGWLAVTRLPAMARAGVALTRSLAARRSNLEGVIPDKVNWKAHNYMHLMEQRRCSYATVLILGVIARATGRLHWPPHVASARSQATRPRAGDLVNRVAVAAHAEDQHGP